MGYLAHETRKLEVEGLFWEALERRGVHKTCVHAEDGLLVLELVFIRPDTYM